MHITSLHIEDLKCFRGPHTLELPRRAEDGSYAGWIVLAGRNGSGKTTLLKALAAIAGGDLSGFHAGMYDEYPAQCRLNIFLGADLVHDEVLKGKARDLVHVKFRGGYGGGIFDLTEVKPFRASAFDKFFSSRDAPFPIRGRGWFLGAWGAHRYLGPYSAADDELAKSDELASISHLFMQNPTLVNALEWLQQLRFRELEEDGDAGALLRRALALVNDGLMPDGVRVVRVSSQGVFARRGEEAEERMQGLAAGYATVASLVLDLLRHLHHSFGAELFEASWEGASCSLPGVVLVDEIEAHLHVSWQQKIGPWLCAHFPAIQFIVTTHSPFICQAASPGGLIRLPSPGTDERIAPVSERAYKAITHGDVGDAVMSELFGLEYSHSPETERIYRRLGELERKVAREQGLSVAEREEWERLHDALPQDLGSVAERELRMLSARLQDAQDKASPAESSGGEGVGGEDKPRSKRARSRKGGG
jgi:predicted ATPase